MNTSTPIVAITDDARRNGKRNEVVGLELSNAQTGRNREESRMTMVTIGWRSGRRSTDGGVVVMNVAVMSAKEDAVDAVGAVEESLGTAGEDAAGEDAKAGEAVEKDAVDARRLILVGVEGMRVVMISCARRDIGMSTRRRVGGTTTTTTMEAVKTTDGTTRTDRIVVDSVMMTTTTTTTGCWRDWRMISRKDDVGHRVRTTYRNS